MTGKSIVLISGGNGGIGFWTALAIAQASLNHHVVIGSRSIENGEKAVQELKTNELKGSISFVQLDVTDQDSIDKALTSVEREFGGVDVLINNAGIDNQTKPLIKSFREIFETNVFGPAVMTDTFLPLLKKSSDARIIYVTSGLGSVTLRGQKDNSFYMLPELVYRMSKSALNMLMACNHAEYAAFGIKTWAVCPGFVQTNIVSKDPAVHAQLIANGAGDARVSGRTIAGVVLGERDEDVGKYIHKDGFYPW